MAAPIQLKTVDEVRAALGGETSDSYPSALAKLLRAKVRCTHDLWLQASKKE